MSINDSSDYLVVISLGTVPQRQSIVDGLRTIALRLDFGVSHNQTFEKYQPFLILLSILLSILLPSQYYFFKVTLA